MSAILVSGHINPDTDTICSAIALAWHLNSNGKEAEAISTGSLNKETQFVLDYFKVATPRLVSEFTETDTIAIVDTNNPDELLPGYDKVTIVSILDHHKLIGGLSTQQPISITVRPVGCAATIILSEIGDASVLPTEIAGLMAGAIVSDTLLFTSPTTTPEDKQAAEMLAAHAGINLQELADNMFAAKSDLTGMSERDIITMDSKIFPMGNKKVRISALETTVPAIALSKRTKLELALAEIKSEEELDAAFLFVVDIIKSESTLIVPSEVEREIASKAYALPFKEETMELPGVVSRKKQMVPPIEQAMTA